MHIPFVWIKAKPAFRLGKCACANPTAHFKRAPRDLSDRTMRSKLALKGFSHDVFVAVLKNNKN